MCLWLTYVARYMSVCWAKVCDRRIEIDFLQSDAECDFSPMTRVCVCVRFHIRRMTVTSTHTHTYTAARNQSRSVVYYTRVRVYGCPYLLILKLSHWMYAVSIRLYPFSCLCSHVRCVLASSFRVSGIYSIFVIFQK